MFQQYYKDLLDRAPTRKQRAVIPAYAVWDELAMLIRTEPHFYTYACGTSCNLAMIGKKLLSNIGYSSPTDTLVSGTLAPCAHQLAQRGLETGT